MVGGRGRRGSGGREKREREWWERVEREREWWERVERGSRW